MSRRRPRRPAEPEEPLLFDLPLDPEVAGAAEESGAEPQPEPEAPVGAAEEPEPEPAVAGDEAEVLPLFEEPSRVVSPALAPRARPPARTATTAPPDGPAGPPEGEERVAAPPSSDAGVALSARWLAGLADLAVHAAVALVLIAGARLLGAPAGFGDWPALVLFLLAFSFLYAVLPLAFWGRTAGMAWAGLVARAPDGASLTFGQTARRWLGGLLTLALLGLPTLLALLGGRSLADRLSGSELHPA